MAPVAADEQGTGAKVIPEYKLVEDEELRFEVCSDAEITIELVHGTAEIFGTELVMAKKYTFGGGARGAVYTWHGCTLNIDGKTDSLYTSKKTPMIIYVNTHAALEQLRQAAVSASLQPDCSTDSGPVKARGPRLMIVGPTDVGKSTYCRLLLNYAVRQGRRPTYVELDVGQGGVAVPGTISALYIERPAHPVDAFDKKAPLVYSFGHLSSGDNIPLYNRLVQNLASAVNQRCAAIADANHAGVIINTCGWVRGEGYASLVHAAEAFEIDVVIVLDHERLYNDLQKDLPTFVKIAHQPKSGGVEERSRQMRILSRRKRVSQYFYGSASSRVNPHSFEVTADDVIIVKIGAEELPDSCLPLGQAPEDHRTKVVTVSWSNALMHRLLALSLCEQHEPIDDDKIIDFNVAGFVLVTNVDLEKKTLSLLSPQPPPLPRKILIWTDITHLDDQ